MTAYRNRLPVRVKLVVTGLLCLAAWAYAVDQETCSRLVTVKQDKQHKRWIVFNIDQTNYFYAVVLEKDVPSLTDLYKEAKQPDAWLQQGRAGEYLLPPNGKKLYIIMAEKEIPELGPYFQIRPPPDNPRGGTPYHRSVPPVTLIKLPDDGAELCSVEW